MGRGTQTQEPRSAMSAGPHRHVIGPWKGPVELQARPGPGASSDQQGLGTTGGAASPAEPRNRRGDSIFKVRKVSTGSAGN